MRVVPARTVLILYKADFFFTAVGIMILFGLCCLDACRRIDILAAKLFSTLPTP